MWERGPDKKRKDEAPKEGNRERLSPECGLNWREKMEAEKGRDGGGGGGD